LRELVERQPVAQAEVIGLSFHVDYWNHLGWRDPYSSARWSDRQRDYAAPLGESTVFTPQIVVAGRSSLVGSDRDGVVAAVAAATERPPERLDVTLGEAEGDSLRLPVRVRLPARGGAGAAGAQRAERLHVALVEDGLSSSVQRGENAGRKLSHVRVVRALHVEALAGGAETSTVDLDLDLELELEPNWARAKLAAVAWVQTEDGLIAAVGHSRRAPQ
jgi:hypothetical protein